MGSLSPSEVAVEGPFSHEFVHTRGVRLHAATAGDPTDPLILLLHDHTGGWFDYIHSISPRAAAGFHVAALDMRGFGMSDKPPSGYGIRYAVGDVAGVIQSLGHKRAHIVGCGSGGAVAWTLAANYPEHTLSLTSMCAADPSDYRQLQRMRPWLLLLDARPIRTPTHRLRSLTHPSFHHTELFAQAADLRTKGADIAHVDDAMRRNARLRSARLPLKWHRDHITRPTLVIHGDGMLCPHFLEFAARRVRGESVSVSHIPETKTLPHVEKPEDFVASLLTFVG